MFALEKKVRHPALIITSISTVWALLTIILLSLEGSEASPIVLVSNILMACTFIVYLLALACYEDKHGCMGDKLHPCLGVYCMAMHMLWFGLTIASVICTIVSFVQYEYEIANGLYLNLLIYAHIWFIAGPTLIMYSLFVSIIHCVRCIYTCCNERIAAIHAFEARQPEPEP